MMQCGVHSSIPERDARLSLASRGHTRCNKSVTVSQLFHGSALRRLFVRLNGPAPPLPV